MAGGAGLGFDGVTVAAGAVYDAIANALMPGTSDGLWSTLMGKESFLVQSMRDKAQGTFEGHGFLLPERSRQV